jgi:hypothetical protein
MPDKCSTWNIQKAFGIAKIRKAGKEGIPPKEINTIFIIL